MFIQPKAGQQPKISTALVNTKPIQIEANGGYVDPRKVFNNEVDLYQSQNFLTLKEDKSKKRQKFDPAKYKIVGVSYPVKIPESQKSRKKYRIQIKFVKRDVVNPTKKNVRVKTINFGTKNVQDYVDDLNERKRITRVNLIEKSQDPFSPNHYRLLLLNRCPTINQAYIKYVSDLGL